MTRDRQASWTVRWLAALFVLGCGFQSQATVIDFDDGTDEALTSAFYSPLGATFTDARWTNDFSATFGSPLGFKWKDQTPLNPTSPDPILIVFVTPQTSVSVQAGGVGDNGAKLVAFDAAVGGNQLDIDQVIHSGIGSGNLDTLSVSAPNIRRVEVSQVSVANSDDGIGWDNLEFIPEPSAFLLAALGLLSLGCRGSRRRR